MYVLDEPSIGLHPANVDGLLAVIRDLVARGNTVIVVDHDARVISAADYVVEMGEGAGKEGGSVIAAGAVREVERSPRSIIGGYLSGEKNVLVRDRAPKSETFALGTIEMRTEQVHTVKPLDVKIPKGRLTVVTGYAG